MTTARSARLQPRLGMSSRPGSLAASGSSLRSWSGALLPLRMGGRTASPCRAGGSPWTLLGPVERVPYPHTLEHIPPSRGRWGWPGIHAFLGRTLASGIFSGREVVIAEYIGGNSKKIKVFGLSLHLPISLLPIPSRSPGRTSGTAEFEVTEGGKTGLKTGGPAAFS